MLSAPMRRVFASHAVSLLMLGGCVRAPAVTSPMALAPVESRMIAATPDVLIDPDFDAATRSVLVETANRAQAIVAEALGGREATEAPHFVRHLRAGQAWITWGSFSVAGPWHCWSGSVSLQPFDGELSDLRLFSHALSNAEIAALAGQQPATR